MRFLTLLVITITAVTATPVLDLELSSGNAHQKETVPDKICPAWYNLYATCCTDPGENCDYASPSNSIKDIRAECAAKGKRALCCKANVVLNNDGDTERVYNCHFGVGWQG